MAAQLKLRRAREVMAVRLMPGNGSGARGSVCVFCFFFFFEPWGWRRSDSPELWGLMATKTIVEEKLDGASGRSGYLGISSRPWG